MKLSNSGRRYRKDVNNKDEASPQMSLSTKRLELEDGTVDDDDDDVNDDDDAMTVMMNGIVTVRVSNKFQIYAILATNKNIS